MPFYRVDAAEDADAGRPLGLRRGRGAFDARVDDRRRARRARIEPVELGEYRLGRRDESGGPPPQDAPGGAPSGRTGVGAGADDERAAGERVGQRQTERVRGPGVGVEQLDGPARGPCGADQRSRSPDSGRVYSGKRGRDLRMTISLRPSFRSAGVVDGLLQDKTFERLPSFFEFLTATSFQYFAQAGMEFVVLEVGMGGRLDATNVTEPRVAVITNVGFDHIEFLGSTLADIAREKAGVIKAGCSVVSGCEQPEAA